MMPQLPFLGFPLDNYRKLKVWIERLMGRDSWVKTQPTTEDIEAFLPQAKTLIQAYLN
jgi:hypothetical protein